LSVIFSLFVTLRGVGVVLSFDIYSSWFYDFEFSLLFDWMSL